MYVLDPNPISQCVIAYRLLNDRLRTAEHPCLFEFRKGIPTNANTIPHVIHFQMYLIYSNAFLLWNMVTTVKTIFLCIVPIRRAVANAS